MSRPPIVTPALLEGIGLAWALGMSFLTAAYFVSYLSGLPMPACIVLATTAAVLLTGCTIVKTRQRTQAMMQRAQVPSPWLAGGYLRLGAWACVALPVLMTVWMAVRSPIAGWDGWSVWAYKAVAFASGGPPFTYFRDQVTLQTHPDYPLNVPIAESLFLHLPGQLALAGASLIGPACFAALLCLVYAGLERLYGAGSAVVGVAILATLPIWIANVPSGSADVPLALYTGGAAVYLLLWTAQRQTRDVIVAGLLAGGAAWTKKEGTAIAVVTLTVLIVIELWRARNKSQFTISPILLPLGAAGVMSLPWLLFLRFREPLSRDFNPVTLKALLGHADRIPHVALVVGQQMLTWSNWGPFWLLLAAGLVMYAKRLSAAERALATLLAAQIGVYMVVFVFSNWQSYLAHAQGTMDRLLLQATPLAVLLFIACWSGSDRVREYDIATRDTEPAAPKAA